MIRLALAQMRRSGGRLLATGLAIALGTGFIAAILLGSGLVRETAYRSVTAGLADADLVVHPAEQSLDRAAVDRLTAVDGVAAAHGDALLPAQLRAGSRADAVLLTAATAAPCGGSRSPAPSRSGRCTAGARRCR